ncbi:MAG: putative aminohydrolase SsnA [Anaerolineae bacterium]|nr:putative aminohydrolase SsnA [Anaerolineae bacterium]
MLITNARVATLGPKPKLRNHSAILIKNGKIAGIGDSTHMRQMHPVEQELDAEGQIALPAALCGHTHFYGAFARGWAYPGPPARNFKQILERLWWRLDKSLTAEDIRYSALSCLVDAIRHGTTTLIDHHASPNAIEGSLDIIADAVVQSGCRAALCYEVSDRDGPARAQAGIVENVRFLQRLAASPHPQLAATFGLHASLTLSDETLADAVQAAEHLNTGFHIHAAEGLHDVEDSLKKSGKRVVHRLHDAGILGHKSILAHAVHVDASEIDVLAGSGSWVTHQPRSNMNNAVGFARVEQMLDSGVKVALGNDGFSNNMFAEMKTAYLTHKLVTGDPMAMPADVVFTLAYFANAKLSQLFWPDLTLGALVAGAPADIILMNYRPPTPLTAENLPWHIIFGYEASAITTTISRGQILMRDRRILTLDETEIMARSQELASKLWERTG